MLKYDEQKRLKVKEVSHILSKFKGVQVLSESLHSLLNYIFEQCSAVISTLSRVLFLL